MAAISSEVNESCMAGDFGGGTVVRIPVVGARNGNRHPVLKQNSGSAQRKNPAQIGRGSGWKSGVPGLAPAGSAYFFGASPGTVTLGVSEVVADGAGAAWAGVAGVAAGGVAGRSLLIAASDSSVMS